MRTTSKHLILIIVLITPFIWAQENNYQYKRKISGVTDKWHRIELPNNIYKNLSKDYSDLRILGITAQQDTIEASYLLKSTGHSKQTKTVEFKILNQTYNEKGSYFTFEVSNNNPLNTIDLSFEESNFDWKIRLEGSHNQKNWFTILEEYRILSLVNNTVDFKHTQLEFPDANYRYYRVFIDTKSKPFLKRASLLKRTTVKGKQNTYENSFVVKNEHKRTVIDVELKEEVPINSIKLKVNSKFDYYRPITIQTLTDSVKTEKGWHYNYKTIGNETLNSVTNNPLFVEDVRAKRLRIWIENADNESLTISDIEIKGNVYELWCRFTKPANYTLFYGNQKRSFPNYDIAHFEANIPKNLTPLTLGPEEVLTLKTPNLETPLFRNKNWLWVLMVLIIVILGWFSFKMIRNTAKSN